LIKVRGMEGHLGCPIRSGEAVQLHSTGIQTPRQDRHRQIMRVCKIE